MLHPWTLQFQLSECFHIPYIPQSPSPTQGADDRVVVGIGRVDRGNSKSSSCMLRLQCHHGGYHCSIPVRDKTSERSKREAQGLRAEALMAFSFFWVNFRLCAQECVCVCGCLPGLVVTGKEEEVQTGGW